MEHKFEPHTPQGMELRRPESQMFLIASRAVIKNTGVLNAKVDFWCKFESYAQVHTRTLKRSSAHIHF